MRLEEAYKILDIQEDADEKTIKQHFHRKISQYHPDASLGTKLENVEKAQKINEAYALLKKSIASGRMNTARKMKKQKEPIWPGKVNEAAFVERNIYVSFFSSEWRQDDCNQVTRGRYLWDPDLEEFELLLRSLNHAVLDLMEQIERQNEIYHVDEYMKKMRFPYQTKLFHCLTSQFIYPVSCLRKIAQPYQTEQSGKIIYKFRAFLGVKKTSPLFYTMGKLKEGDLLYPVSLKNNRIMVADADGSELGHLSIEEDQLYYILIPILESHKAQVKIVVDESQVNRKHRPFQVTVNVALYLRMEQSVEEIIKKNQNLVIAGILEQYDTFIKKEYS